MPVERVGNNHIAGVYRGVYLGQGVEDAVVVHSLGNDPSHEKLASDVFTQWHTGFAQKIGQQNSGVGLIGLAMGIEDGHLFVGKGSQLLGAEVERLALVGLDSQLSGGSGRRRVFHLLGNQQLPGEERERERRNGKNGGSTHHSAILEQSSIRSVRVSPVTSLPDERLNTGCIFRRLEMSGSFAIRNTVVVLLLAFSASIGCTAATKTPLPAPAHDAPLAQTPGKQTAVFAGGCFWGTQSVFERVKGVLDTTAGYSGGSASTATYQQVGQENTGHAESVKVVYDPSKITYGQLLQIFFSVVHDPTQLNRQGPDVGESYRSVIFYSNDEQQKISKDYIAQLDAAKAFHKPIVTQVVPLKGFYDAESYHQDYALHNPNNPYILVCDRPKVEALKQQFPELFKDYRGK